MKRTFLVWTLLALCVSTNVGCLLNQYSPDQNTRAEQLVNQAENLRQVQGEWRRFWMNDMPSHLTWDRIDGRIAP